MGSAAYSVPSIISGLAAKPRQGWVIRDVHPKHQESVLWHKQKLVVASMLAAPHYAVSVAHVAALAMVHDMPEKIEPDRTPHDVEQISTEDKHALEWHAMAQLAPAFGPFEERVLSLYSEYDEGKTRAARLVKQLDKIDFAIRGLNLEKLGYDVDSQFCLYNDIRGKVHDYHLRTIYDRTLELHRGTRRRRNAYIDYFTMLALGRAR